MQTPFHAYYTARKLASYAQDNSLLPAFASSNIEIYPYQIAAAQFALRSQMLKGVILADEGSLGKTYEALLITSQKWYEGKEKLLLILPTNLIKQWIVKIENSFSLPYILIDTEESHKANAVDNDNPFDQPALVITTYDFAVSKANDIAKIKWDMVIFDEASCLSKCYTGQNKTATTLKEATTQSFKLLLTPTPITMSIMDIYGLIYFIDEMVLPDEKIFYDRYFRKPENYPELTSWVSKYCFRTLKSQVTDYVGFSNRIPYTINYELIPQEKELYKKLDEYLSLPQKFAYPKMDRYELTLMFYHTASSSAQALIKTLDGAISRLDDCTEKEMLRSIRSIAESIDINGKTKELLSVLEKCFTRLKQLKTNQNTIIFTDNRTTQNHLKEILSNTYKVLTYSGVNSRDYTVMEQFRNDKNIQILIATDEAAKGLDIEFCPVIINYDLLYNAVELEQRINRCHRQGQTSDVLVINLLGKDNFSDVRILELINKRVLQFDGIFGMSDEILGSFDTNIKDVLSQLRPTEEVKTDFDETLRSHVDDNKQLIAHSEDTLFTTFTKAVADKVTVTPQYIEDKIKEIDAELWQVIKYYFEDYNNETSCFNIDEQTQTITAINEPPRLFYYWSGNRNVPYKSLRAYGMDKNFKPHHGRITLGSVLAKGVFHNIACSDTGNLIVDAKIDSCKIGFYTVTVKFKGSDVATYNVLIGKSESGQALSSDECEKIFNLPVVSYITDGRKTEYWLRGSTGQKGHCELDGSISSNEYIDKYLNEHKGEQAERIELLKRKTAVAKTKLERSLDEIKAQIKTADQALSNAADRLQKISADKQLKLLQHELKKKEDGLFFDQMRLDLQLEEEIKAFVDNEKMTAKMHRQFVIKVEGQ